MPEDDDNCFTEKNQIPRIFHDFCNIQELKCPLACKTML